MDPCANILYLPIVVMSLIDNMAVTLHQPQLSQISSNPLYLAYNADGPGHYDCTKALTQEDIGDEVAITFFRPPGPRPYYLASGPRSPAPGPHALLSFIIFFANSRQVA